MKTIDFSILPRQRLWASAKGWLTRSAWLGAPAWLCVVWAAAGAWLVWNALGIAVFWVRLIGAGDAALKAYEKMAANAPAAPAAALEKLKASNLFAKPAETKMPVCLAILGDKALIDGQWMTAGQKHGQIELVRIEPSAAVVRVGGQEKTLRPFDVAVEAPSAPRGRGQDAAPSASFAAPTEGPRPSEPRRGERPPEMRRDGRRPDWEAIRRRFESMTPQQRQEMFERYRNATPEQQRQMREEFIRTE